MTPVIEATSMSVAIGEKRLLDNVTLSVGPGEIVALIGPNGAGKSTLLRALAGEIGPSSGTVHMFGRAIAAYPPAELALRRAVLSQSVSVSFPFTVAEVVRMGAMQRRGHDVERFIDEALAQLDIAALRDRIIGTLSGGEQQRSHFARILVQASCGAKASGPGLILFDEPTSSLDLRHQLDVIAAIRRFASRGFAIVTILHDLNIAAMLSGRVIMLSEGRMLADGPPAYIITEHMVRRAFDVAGSVGEVPPHDTPFVLPHRAARPELSQA